MKDFAAMLLAACLLLGALSLPAQAVEDEIKVPSASLALEMGTPSPEQASPSPDGSSPSPTTVPEDKGQTVRLSIDNKNLYEHMTRTYSQGYIPSVEKGEAVLVLPLLCEGELQGNTLRAKLVLEAGGAFVAKNYEKTVDLAVHKVNGGKAQVRGYCVSFSIQLAGGRVNGSYPVGVIVSGRDKNGGEVREEFSLFVSVTDGKDPNATPPPEPVPTPSPEPPAVLVPKVLVQSTEAVSLAEGAEAGIVNAGDPVRVKITLRNTSETQGLSNLAVTAGSPGEGFQLTSPSDSLYLGELAAGGTVDVTYEYWVKPETPAGQYQIPLSYDFAYHKGETGAGAGVARVDISQPLKLEFSLSRMPAEAVISDTVEVNVQAINLSHAKAYNVRATLEGDGLLPSGTAFIGDLDPGTSLDVPLSVGITGLTESDFSYGQTTGSITYLYEDAQGREFTETGSFIVNIKTPFSGEPNSPEPDDPGQFWVVLGAVGAVIAAMGGTALWSALRRRKQ